MVLGRLGRVLRQQSADGLGYPLISLLFAVERAQPVTATALAALEGVSPPSVSRSLGELEAAGFLAREQVDADRRSTLIRLTDAGAGECDLLRRSRDAWLAEHLARLTADEQAALGAALPALERLFDPEVRAGR